MFVTFEGSEGSGKSTQIRMLAEVLTEHGFDVLMTREPGGTIIGEQVRTCLHDPANQQMTAAAEVLLYSASRAQLVEEVIRPALESGKIVLSDRYVDSTLAYQGYGRQLDIGLLTTIGDFATGGLVPDVTFFLDVAVEKGLARRSDSGGELNRMDLQTVAFYKRVRDGYIKLAAHEPDRWVIVNADRPVDSIHAELQKALFAHLGLPG